jgi:hypothetical protein
MKSIQIVLTGTFHAVLFFNVMADLHQFVIVLIRFRLLGAADVVFQLRQNVFILFQK